MKALEQFKLFDDEIFNQPVKAKSEMNDNMKSLLKKENKLLNEHILPLLKESGINIEQLKVCVRDVYENWMIIEVATIDTCVSMTVWNNGNKDYIHFKSNLITEAFLNQYFSSRYKPAQLFYLEKKLERNVVNF